MDGPLPDYAISYPQDEWEKTGPLTKPEYNLIPGRVLERNPKSGISLYGRTGHLSDPTSERVHCALMSALKSGIGRTKMWYVMANIQAIEGEKINHHKKRSEVRKGCALSITSHPGRSSNREINKRLPWSMGGCDLPQIEAKDMCSIN